MKLKGKMALVTGSSSGIGKGIALRLAEEGADIIVHYHSRKQEAIQVVKNIRKLGRRTIAFQADLAEVAQIHKLVDQAWNTFGHIDILVNNAGILLSSGFSEVTEKDWDKVLDVNLKGVFFCAQAVAKKMIESKIQGKIINVSSNSGTLGEPYLAAYCASKGGVNMLTRSLAIELGPYNININGISPGFIEDTNINFAEAARNPIYMKHCLLITPCKRFGKVEDLLGVVVLLASDESNYIQGETIVIDGGMMIQMEDDLGPSGGDTSYRLEKHETKE
ncbi:3-oxoacyl-[acyl-carrier-protein] reductase FabG [subsurface metagenome]